MLIYVFWENIILLRFLEVRAGSCSNFSPNLRRTLSWLMDAKLKQHNKAFSNQSRVISLFVAQAYVFYYEETRITRHTDISRHIHHA